MLVRIYLVTEQAGVTLVALALLAGCSAIHPDIALKREDSVAIVVSNDVGWPGPPAPGRVRVLTEAKTELRTGAGAGAVAGAALGLLCGPLAPYCVPMGALQGANVGALGGAVVGSAAALPAETAERLRDRVERALQSHDLRALIELDVAERVQGHWNLKSDKPTATVEVRLQEFALLSARDQRVRCSFKINVAVREQLMQQPWPGNQRRLYEYVCPYEDLARWLDESQGVIEANLAAASRYLAAEIVSGLAGTK